jgi:hypothetical protein
MMRQKKKGSAVIPPSIMINGLWSKAFYLVKRHVYVNVCVKTETELTGCSLALYQFPVILTGLFGVI